MALLAFNNVDARCDSSQHPAHLGFMSPGAEKFGELKTHRVAPRSAYKRPFRECRRNFVILMSAMKLRITLALLAICAAANAEIPAGVAKADQTSSMVDPVTMRSSRGCMGRTPCGGGLGGMANRDISNYGGGAYNTLL